MKKLILLIFMMSLLGLGLIENSDDEFLKKFLGLKFNYVLSYSSCAEGDDLIDVGFIKIGFYSDDNLNNINQKNKEYIQSQTVVLNNKKIEDVFKLFDIKIIDAYQIDGIKVYNCYSKDLKKVNYERGYKFNLQIAENFDEIKIGYPTISEGF